jgi:hypothetical protein
MMETMPDFTNFKMGQTVEGELIVVCPYCHRHAVKRESLGIQFVHLTGAIEIDGCIELLEDSCPAKPVLPANLPRITD